MELKDLLGNIEVLELVGLGKLQGLIEGPLAVVLGLLAWPGLQA